MRLFGWNPSRRYINRIYNKQPIRIHLWTPLFTQKHELPGTSWPENNSSDHEGYKRCYSLVLESKNGFELRQSSTLALSNRKRSLRKPFLFLSCDVTTKPS